MPALIGALVGAGIGLGATVVTPAVLAFAGFSAGGVVAGSIAAGVQSSIGNVAAGSMFATLQSIGATGGLSLVAKGAVTAGAAVVGAIL